MLETILFCVALIAMLVGSYSDLKTLEVSDWLNYSLIAIGFGIRAIFAAVLWDWTIIAWGVAGLVAAIIIAYAMYYTGQWGGGDAKMLMGLGVLLATFPLAPFELPLLFFILFFILSLLCGAVLGVLFSVLRAFQRPKGFKKEWKKLIGTATFRRTRIVTLLVVVLLVITTVIAPADLRALSSLLALIVFAGFYLMCFVKTVEKGCLVEPIHPDKLVEGDWIVEDITIDGKRIVGPKDLGITTEQIAMVKEAYDVSKIKRILVKYGMPFIPSFLCGLLVAFIWGSSVVEWLFFLY